MELLENRGPEQPPGKSHVIPLEWHKGLDVLAPGWQILCSDQSSVTGRSVFSVTDH